MIAVQLMAKLLRTKKMSRYLWLLRNLGDKDGFIKSDKLPVGVIEEYYHDYMLDIDKEIMKEQLIEAATEDGGFFDEIANGETCIKLWQITKLRYVLIQEDMTNAAIAG